MLMRRCEHASLLVTTKALGKNSISLSFIAKDVTFEVCVYQSPQLPCLLPAKPNIAYFVSINRISSTIRIYV